MEKVALKATNPEQGKKAIEYLESLGGVNKYAFRGDSFSGYYWVDIDRVIHCSIYPPEDYTETFLPEECKPTELKLPEDIKTFRATAALMRLSFYKVEDEERFSKAVRDADELIKELNK